MDVALEVIEASNWREALDVRVGDEQLAFVADHQPIALVILAKCHVRPGGHRWEPLLVRDQSGAAVGVLGIAHGVDGCELRNFAIDVEAQGRGIGTSAVKAVIERAHHSERDCQELIVTAHPDNHAAHAVYGSAGFVWNGEKRGIEPVWRLTVDRAAR